MAKTMKRKEGLKDEAPVLHHDAPAPKKTEDSPALKTDAPGRQITVMIAACGLLLVNELKCQKNSGIVKQYGQLMLDDALLQPNEIYTLPWTAAVEKAIIDGWVVDMGA